MYTYTSYIEERRWAIVRGSPKQRLGVVEIAPSPHHCFRTAHPCAQSVNGSPTEPVLSRSSRQRIGHIQSHFDGGWHVCPAVFTEPQSPAVCRRVERRDCAHEALLRLQSASSWLVMEQLVLHPRKISKTYIANGAIYVIPELYIVNIISLYCNKTKLNIALNTFP